MKAAITIDGVNYTAEDTISLAMAQWPMLPGRPGLNDAVSMLRMMGSKVITSPKCVVGIDNGVTGAIVVLAASNGDLLAKAHMPSRKRGGKNEIDSVALADWLLDNLEQLHLHDFVLERPVGSQSVNAAVSMHGSYHAIRSTIEVLGGNFHDVSAKEWQKAMLRKGDTKEQSIFTAVTRWPNEDWRKSDRAKKPYPDFCDAANIAEYYRTK